MVHHIKESFSSNRIDILLLDTQLIVDFIVLNS